MIYTVLPTGSFHGWGVCGKYLVKELSKITDVKLVTEGLTFANIQDELDFRLLMQAAVSDDEQSMIASGAPVSLEAPVLQNIVDKSLRPSIPTLRGSFTVGYTFFEDSILRPEWIENGRNHFDFIVTGSTWCEEILRSYGLDNVATIIQGVDPTIFNMTHSEKEYMQDSFVLFSGGKFELRKGQDLVIRAFRVLQDRYSDVILMTSWYNHWAASMNTMRLSPHIRFNPVSGEYSALMNRTLVENGVNPDRVITLPPYPNVMMTRFYRNSDVGVFPNRCEGGTNLVLMEYMACGKPVIASHTSGHRDILTAENSLELRALTPLTISDTNGPVAVWDEPNLDELIAHLDWAYHHRSDLKRIGQQAGMDLCIKTWDATGRDFYALLTHQHATVGEWT